MGNAQWLLMRILGGSSQRKKLVGPSGRETRPLTALMRKSLFDRLRIRIVGARVADIFAGSGSFGFEALSRGAAHVTFVESGREAIKALHENQGASGMASNQCHIAPFQAEDWVGRQRGSGERYDVVLVDPPFPWPWPDGWLEELAVLLNPGGVLLVRRHFKTPWPSTPTSLNLEKEIRYGDSMVRWYSRG